MGISASPARKLLHGTVSLQLASNYSTTEGIQYRREEYKTKGISYHSLKLFREQRMLFLLNEIFGSHIQEVCMTNCDVRFPSLAIQGALGCRPPLAYLQRNCGCGIFHCVFFSSVSCFHATKRPHSPFAKKGQILCKKETGQCHHKFCLILTHCQ